MSPATTEPDPREVTLDGVRVPYTVSRSDRATRSRIDVDLRGVRVVLPTGARTDPERLLVEHAAWVVERRAAYAERRAAVPDRRFEPGATFPLHGEPHELVVERRSRSAVGEGSLRLARHHVEQTSVRRAVECLYRRKAREAFEEHAERYAPRLGVEYERIEVRNQRTRWGSCSSTGTLSLNWRLVMGPPDVAEYVVVHELAHLEDRNHSEAFWAVVESVLPGYRARRAWLQEHRLDLIFDEGDL